ncbi:MAG TPA: hypothetical protein VNM48_20510, partial [Chloroflexota bacterium]|nr:hypothetical protein [Chloroflexota bacterium]
RAARVDALLRINASLLQELADQQKRLAQLEDADTLRRHLQAVLDAAPDVSCDWKRPAPPCRYTVTEWDWCPNDGRTPERFEAALDAADRWVNGTPSRSWDD